ncbi:MAG: hypothetical protein HZB67_05595 [Candidatus Aenigmarchaeota archaeon]|nr:hypothetical protein [Candidatus Aenigmarchaeota archaeon]
MRAYKFDNFDEGVKEMEARGYVISRGDYSVGYVYPANVSEYYPRALNKSLACAFLSYDGSLSFLNEGYSAVEKCHEEIKSSLHDFVAATSSTV